MAKLGVGDGIDFLAYFTGFWLFVFSREFRQAWIQEFMNSSWLGKLSDAIEAASAIFFGVIVPTGLVYFLVNGE